MVPKQYIFLNIWNKRWISDWNRNTKKQAKLSYFYTIKIAKLYEISKLISVSILIGNPPHVFVLSNICIIYWFWFIFGSYFISRLIMFAWIFQCFYRTFEQYSIQLSLFFFFFNLANSIWEKRKIHSFLLLTNWYFPGFIFIDSFLQNSVIKENLHINKCYRIFDALLKTFFWSSMYKIQKCRAFRCSYRSRYWDRIQF